MSWQFVETGKVAATLANVVAEIKTRQDIFTPAKT
jgi:hypothetical protein